MMSELFGVEVNTINYRLKEIYKTAELQENRTIRKFGIVQNEGSREVSREVDFYNLDAIISVGYRVNSSRATQRIENDFEKQFVKKLKSKEISSKI